MPIVRIHRPRLQGTKGRLSLGGAIVAGDAQKRVVRDGKLLRRKQRKLQLLQKLPNQRQSHNFYRENEQRRVELRRKNVGERDEKAEKGLAHTIIFNS